MAIGKNYNRRVSIFFARLAQHVVAQATGRPFSSRRESHDDFDPAVKPATIIKILYCFHQNNCLVPPVAVVGDLVARPPITQL